MQRRDDWASRLISVIDAADNKPFAWGNQDCALFAADCVQAMTGEDFAAPFRGRYDTALGSVRALKMMGYASLEEYVIAVLGEPINANTAGRGDVVMVDTPEGKALGVVAGIEAAVAGVNGLVLMPRDCWLSAWRI